MADPDVAVATTSEIPVRIAYDTSTFVAASILRLQEKGQLEIDDGIPRHLPDASLEILERDGYACGWLLSVRSEITRSPLPNIFSPCSASRTR
jgi:hypothetical protein